MMTPAVGIDLGTSTSEAAVFENGRPVPIPDPQSRTRSPIVLSLVAATSSGKLLVGEPARALVDRPGFGAREFKRDMGSAKQYTLGGQSFRPETLSAAVLRRLRENAQVFLGTDIESAVVSVPANFSDPARTATANAVEIAGLKALHLINEPTAAALAFGVTHLETEEQLVVFDFGGGTLDVTVLEMLEGTLTVHSSFGDTQLGGKDFDDAVREMLLTKFRTAHADVSIPERSYAAMKEPAEAAKIALSQAQSHDLFIPGLASRGGDMLNLECAVTRDEFETAIAPLLDRARECLERALQAGAVTRERVDRVLLVGGTTYIPAVRHLVAEFFGREPRRDVDPDLAVAMGAATEAALRLGQIDPAKGIIRTDVSAFGLGIDIVAEVGGQHLLMYEPLIRPNAPIPHMFKERYSLLHPDQREMSIHLYQDRQGHPVPLELGLAQGVIQDTGVAGEVTDIPPAQYGEPHPVDVEFSYSEDGIARLKATIPGFQREVSIAFEASALRLGTEQVAVERERLRQLSADTPPAAAPEEPWRDTPEGRQYLPLILKAERLATEKPEHRESLQQASAAMKAALASGDNEQVERAGDTLTDLLLEAEDVF